jgi:hypothetical protein
MTYATGDIPVGAQNPNSIANLGLGLGAIDGGGGYTYLNPATGHTFSGVAGFTYNFKNPDTQVQSGVDFHFDWSAAQFLSKRVFVGLVGYPYQQVSSWWFQVPGFSEWARRPDASSRSEACRDIRTSRLMRNLMRPIGSRAGIHG